MIEARERIRTYIVENFLFGDGRGLDDSTSFLDSGIIDSTGILELIGFLENAFAFKVADDELVPENLDSIDCLVRFMALKTGAP